MEASDTGCSIPTQSASVAALQLPKLKVWICGNWERSVHFSADIQRVAENIEADGHYEAWWAAKVCRDPVLNKDEELLLMALDGKVPFAPRTSHTRVRQYARRICWEQFMKCQIILPVKGWKQCSEGCMEYRLALLIGMDNWEAVVEQLT